MVKRNNMKRKLIYLPSKHSKDIVDNINGYFDKGYDIEGILDADAGCYLVLILNNNENYKYTDVKKFDLPYNKLKLIEENATYTRHFPQHPQHWTSTNTEDIKPN